MLKMVRVFCFLVALIVLGACGGSTTDEAVGAEETVAEVVDEIDEEVGEEETEDDALVEEAPESSEDPASTDESADADEVVAEDAEDTEDPEDAVGDGAAAAEADEGAVETEATVETSSGVELLDAGVEPRQELRYTFAEGTETRTTLAVQTIAQSIDGTDAPASPSVGTITEEEITTTLDGDVIQFESVVIDARASDDTDPSISGLLEASLGPIIGLSASGTVDNLGAVAEGEVGEVGDPTLDPILQGLANVSNPLPVEAVGVGAVWTTENPLDAVGLSVINRSTFTLREFTDNGFIADVVIEQLSSDVGQEVDLGGVFATVDAWDSTGTGVLEVALDRLAPVLAESTVDSFQAFTIGGQGSLEQTISIETTITGG